MAPCNVVESISVSELYRVQLWGTNLESVEMLPTGDKSVEASSCSSCKSHSSRLVSLEKSSSTAPARVPVASNGGAEPGDHAKAAVRGISRNRTIVRSLLAVHLGQSKHTANKLKMGLIWRKRGGYGIIIDQRYKGASSDLPFVTPAGLPPSAQSQNLGHIAASPWHQRSVLAFLLHAITPNISPDYTLKLTSTNTNHV